MAQHWKILEVQREVSTRVNSSGLGKLFKYKPCSSLLNSSRKKPDKDSICFEEKDAGGEHFFIGIGL